MLSSLTLALLLSAAASAAPAVAPDAPAGETLPELSTGPAAIAHLVGKVLRDGEGAVLRGDQAGFAGVDDPSTFKVLHFPKGADGMTHSVFVGQNQSTRPGELDPPKILLFVTRRVEPRLEEWRYIRLAMDGTFIQATSVTDRLDREGILRAGGRRIRGAPAKVGQKWLEHEIEYYFEGKHRREP